MPVDEPLPTGDLRQRAFRQSSPPLVRDNHVTSPSLTNSTILGDRSPKEETKGRVPAHDLVMTTPNLDSRIVPPVFRGAKEMTGSSTETCNIPTCRADPRHAHTERSEAPLGARQR